jgi:PadR family transcriptional regulator PadR
MPRRSKIKLKPEAAEEAVEFEPDGVQPEAGTAAGPTLTPPRDLLTAYTLLLLRNWNMHGYQLMQQLMQFGFRSADPGTVYRLLRQLEKQGFVRSSWETGEAGPARRTYTITDAGEAFLRTWATAIENYQKTLKFWTDLYSGMLTPPKED